MLARSTKPMFDRTHIRFRLASGSDTTIQVDYTYQLGTEC